MEKNTRSSRKTMVLCFAYRNCQFIIYQGRAHFMGYHSLPGGYCPIPDFIFLPAVQENQQYKNRRVKALPTQHPAENERGYNGGIALDNKFRSVDVQLSPGNFFVRHGSGVRAKARGAVADLAEIAPEGDVFPFQILVHHGHNAYRKISRN